MKQELHSQGADTERLQQISSQLRDIDRELQFIKEHATLLIEYQKDKRDLIDHIPEWKREQEEQKRQLSQEKDNLRRETSGLQEQIDALNKELQQAEKEVTQLQANLEAYSKISAYDWYKPHQDIFNPENPVTLEIHTPRTCLELIDELGRTDSQYMTLQNRLRKEVNLFTGHFDEENTFKFKTKFTEDWEYIRFAEELHDFVEENKISEFVRRINNEHSDIFKRISMDTSMLTASEDDIQDLIGQVNKGFQTCNFVGVIQCIEMKVEESSNRVVNCLRAIQKYYNEHAYDLTPGTNLFSSENEQLVKQEAIALLRDFIKEIHAYRYDSIRLYDSFELRFRIIENNNDTGFVEKLSNVGSEGTDILVKAMINIMLLNVFKEGASRKFKDFKLHCMMDEIGKLHPNNVNGILKFANDRNIILINGSPTELNRDAYKHVYLLTKGAQSKTRIARLISDQKL
jgi:predicted nuclease with TOPRIM domain